MYTFEQVRKYEAILGVKHGADLNEIKQAYREKAKILHPDKAKLINVDPKESTEKFKELNSAYEALIKIKESQKEPVVTRPWDPDKADATATEFASEVTNRTGLQSDIKPEMDLDEPTTFYLHVPIIIEKLGDYAFNIDPNEFSSVLGHANVMNLAKVFSNKDRALNYNLPPMTREFHNPFANLQEDSYSFDYNKFDQAYFLNRRIPNMIIYQISGVTPRNFYKNIMEGKKGFDILKEHITNYTTDNYTALTQEEKSHLPSLLSEYYQAKKKYELASNKHQISIWNIKDVAHQINVVNENWQNIKKMIENEITQLDIQGKALTERFNKLQIIIKTHTDLTKLYQQSLQQLSAKDPQLIQLKIDCEKLSVQVNLAQKDYEEEQKKYEKAKETHAANKAKSVNKALEYKEIITKCLQAKKNLEALEGEAVQKKNEMKKEFFECRSKIRDYLVMKNQIKKVSKDEYMKKIDEGSKHQLVTHKFGHKNSPKENNQRDSEPRSDNPLRLQQHGDNKSARFVPANKSGKTKPVSEMAAQHRRGPQK